MIIESFLDTDFYKLTMGQLVWKMARNTAAKYWFQCRGGQDLTPIIPDLRKEISSLMRLSITTEERNYLASLTVKNDADEDVRIFKDGYLDYLTRMPMDPDNVRVDISDLGHVHVTGPWVSSIYLEVPILAIINELYYKKVGTPQVSYHNLNETIQTIRVDGLKFSDFGTRRRRSLGWHINVVESLRSRCPDRFTGTSNVMLAMKYRLKPIGTMAHEWIQAGQAMSHPMDSQRLMLEGWERHYPKCMRIALSDTLGNKKFLDDWAKDLAESYAGVRHDSGDPFAWTEALLAHYKSIGVDTRNKTFVYSDCVTAEKAVDIYARYHNYVGISFGIGTHLTNNFGPTEAPAMQNVIKLVELQGRPVAKLSGVRGKEICSSPAYMKWLKEMLGEEA
jgi:nicotinate phosphoribosyltransferase